MSPEWASSLCQCPLSAYDICLSNKIRARIPRSLRSLNDEESASDPVGNHTSKISGFSESDWVTNSRMAFSILMGSERTPFLHGNLRVLGASTRDAIYWSWNSQHG